MHIAKRLVVRIGAPYAAGIGAPVVRRIGAADTPGQRPSSERLIFLILLDTHIKASDSMDTERLCPVNKLEGL